ncbi:ATP synthase F(0) complex subunit j, mitochondrial isoform X1 [Lissotriton helveticus]
MMEGIARWWKAKKVEKDAVLSKIKASRLNIVPASKSPRTGDSSTAMAGQALTAWWARMRPYYTKVHQEMWVGVAIMGYFYYKLSYGGKKAAVKDKSSGHH